MIKEGCTRKVFVFNKFVIKIPTLKQYNLFLQGLLANLNEKKWSNKHSDLAKVIYANKFGLFLIMEKAEVLPNNIDWNKFQIMIYKKYKNDHMKCLLLKDIKPSNFGYIKGKLVKIDYG